MACTAPAVITVVGTVIYALPPHHIHVVHVRVLRPEHERRHEFEDGRLVVFETRVIQCLQGNDLRAFHPVRWNC